MTKQPTSCSMLTLAVSVVLSLSVSSSVNAQLVFDKSDVDGSFGQPSVLDTDLQTYAAQPFEVTSALVNADAIEYHTVFSADTVLLNNGDASLDVRTWIAGRVYFSTAADALNGTPTATALIDPLESVAANGQEFQELIVPSLGPNGEENYTFLPVADLGTSLDFQPYHQLTEVLGMDTLVLLQDDTTTTLGNFLATHEGQTLYLCSVLANGIVDGSYEIAVDENLGTEGIIFSFQGGFEVQAGAAHRITAVNEPLLGDVNQDGAVNFSDIPAFIGVLQAGEFQAEADCNEDGEVTFADIPAFIAILQSS